MQDSRWFRIVYTLLDTGKCTASELAEKLEVSVRTIYRDLDALSAAGIPVYATQGKGGGVSLLPEYVLDNVLLSGEEKEKILMALQDLSVADETAGELLVKLGALFQTRAADWIEVDFSDWKKSAWDQDVFNAIKTAIFKKVLVTFSYFGSSGGYTQRTVEPLKLVFKGKDWYLYGFCRLRKDFRFFKLTRIKGLAIGKETFMRDVPTDLPIKAPLRAENLVAVSLKFTPEAAFRVYDEFSDAVTTDAQGNLYVSVDLPDHGVLFSYLLSFGDSVEVLEPASVREQVKEKLISMLRIYKT